MTFDPASHSACPDVSVVVPVLDEADVLPRCHREVAAALDRAGLDFEIVFVDDGSTDGSWAIMRDLVERDPRVVAIRLRRNVGQQRALMTGLRHARGAAVIAYDADLQFAPSCLPELARRVLAGTPLVSGIRRRRRDSLLQRIPSRVGRRLVSTALRTRIEDFGAVKAFSRDLVDELVASDDADLNVYAAAYDLAPAHAAIPVEHHARREGRSKWSVFKRVEMYFDIYTAYAPRPFGWMMATGFACLVASAIVALGIVAYKLVQPRFAGTIVFFDVFLFFTGLHLFSLSLVGEFVVRTFRRARTSGGADVVATVCRGAAPARGDADADAPTIEVMTWPRRAPA